MILYIDPGTGSMLFTILLGVLGTGFYFLRNAFVKLKFLASGGKAKDGGAEKLPIVIFSDSKRYWNVFEPICDEFEKREQKVVYMTASEDDPALEKDYKYIESKFIGTGNKAFSKLNMLKAYVVLSTTPSLDVFQWKRSKEVDYYIHIPHAPNDITLYRMFGLDFYDAILLSGEYQGEEIRKLEEIRNLPEKDIEYIGIPFMDEMAKRLEKMPKKKTESDKRTVLLAPSWGESGILAKYGEKLIDALIDTGYEIIVRPHPQSFTSDKELIDRLMKKYPDGEKLSWNRDNDNFEVLNKSDILISDFSGVFFDYSLVFDKPIIYTDYDFDKNPYDCYQIEDELWTFKTIRKIGKELTLDNVESIKEVIDECINSKQFGENREKARQETWMHRGEGAKRTVDYVLRRYEEYVKKEA